MGGVVTAVTLAFSPFTSYVKETDGRLKPNDCLDFRILDTIAQFYNITVSPQGDWVPFVPLPITFPPGKYQGALRWSVGKADGERVLDRSGGNSYFSCFKKVFVWCAGNFVFQIFCLYKTFVFGWEPWKKGRLTSRWTWLWLAQGRKWSTTLWHT